MLNYQENINPKQAAKQIARRRYAVTVIKVYVMEANKGTKG